MRKFSLFMVVVMLLSAGNLLASEAKPKPKDPAKTLSAQIGDLLGSNSFIVESSDLTAKIRFTLNEDKEIVVLSVETDHEALEAFVKSRLNYQKVNLSNAREGKMYTVPVRITE